MKRICTLSPTQKTPLLVDYEIENYGETAPFIIPGNAGVNYLADDRRNRSGMPKEYVYKTGRDFNWNLYDTDIEIQKKISNAFVIHFKEFRKQGRGLYIHSQAKGSGKTMLACCLANEVLKTHDISVKFISMPEYIELVKDKRDEKIQQRETILDAALLILDDIGAAVEDKEWIRNSIFRLINRRHENLLPTIYTSNVPIDKLKCGERVTSRIYEDSFQLSMPEISIRMKKADISKAEFFRQVTE